MNTRKLLISELVAVRERGIFRVDSPNPRLKRLELPQIRKLIDPNAESLSFTAALHHLIATAISRLPDEPSQTVSRILFCIDKTMLDSDPVGWRQKALVTYEALSAREGVSLDDFRKGPELELLGLIAAEMEAVATVRSKRSVPGRVQIAPEGSTLDGNGTESVDTLIVERSLFHVVRALEARLEGAKQDARAKIETALELYRKWHTGEVQNATLVLGALDSVSQAYCGRSVYELRGRVEQSSNRPTFLPNQRLPWLPYEDQGSLVLIQGGVDPFTGEEVGPYYIGAYPVTTFEWQDFLGKLNWQPSVTWKRAFERLPGWQEDEVLRKLPAFGMNFHDCLAFCYWLWKTGPYRFRLPTEAEWNFAATGGRRMHFPWGDNASYDLGNFARTGTSGEIMPVDHTKPSGRFRLSGMAGNIWEYVSTLWQGDTPVPGSNIEIPDIISSMTHRGWWEADSRIVLEVPWQDGVKVVMKGGSWGLGPEYASAATRIYTSLTNLGEYGGFRLAVKAIYNPHTDSYFPEPSPFLNAELQRVEGYQSPKELTNDLIAGAIEMKLGAGCAGFFTLGRSGFATTNDARSAGLKTHFRKTEYGG